MTALAAELEPGASVADARRQRAAEFRRRGLETPELDARLLVAHALALDHTGLATHAHRRLSVKEAGAIAALAARRLAREPVARILGRKEFWGLPLRLNPEQEKFLDNPGANALRTREYRKPFVVPTEGAV